MNQANNDITTRLKIIRKADLEIKGFSYPERVWYGGKVVGEAAMVSYQIYCIFVMKTLTGKGENI